MKKKFMAMCMAAVMTVSLTACGSGGSAGSGSSGDDGKAKIGLSMPTQSLERWNRDGAYLEEQFQNAGYDTILTYSDNDSGKQVNDIQNILAQTIGIGFQIHSRISFHIIISGILLARKYIKLRDYSPRR